MMVNNNFVLSATPKQIVRSYAIQQIANSITAIRHHQDDGAPAVDVEFAAAPISRIDYWQWEKTDEGTNRWILKDTSPFDEDELPPAEG